MQLNIRKTNNPTKNGQTPKQTFLQRKHRDGHQTHEKYSTLLIIREMQIKTPLRYLTSYQSERPLSKDLQTNAGEDVEKRELSCTVGGNVN